MRAPLPPMACPMAMAPPFTFTLSWLKLKSSIAAIATGANASLISHKSIASACRPALSNTFEMALLGAVVNHSGA